MSVAALILAAGASTRMGSPKPLLPWGDTCLLAWELDVLRRSTVDEIVVVTGAFADDVRRALPAGSRRHCVFNPLWAQGRSTSLAAGANALLAPSRTRPSAIVIQNVDQPTRADIIDRLVDELRATGAEAVQPSLGAARGHPVVVDGSLLEELAGANEAELGLRAILQRHPPLQIPMDAEPIVRIDLDTPDTLDEGRRLCGVPSPTAAG